MKETADKIKHVILDGVSKTLHFMELIDEEDREHLEEEL